MQLRLEAAQGFAYDDVYARLLALGHQRSEQQTQQAMAALVLVLINHIGDEAVVNEAIGLVQNFPAREVTTKETNHA